MLNKLFKPESVALIGASDRPGSFGADAAKSLLKSKDRIRFYFVNQRKPELFGVKTYVSVNRHAGRYCKQSDCSGGRIGDKELYCIFQRLCGGSPLQRSEFGA